jgi:hypothetical protein
VATGLQEQAQGAATGLQQQALQQTQGVVAGLQAASSVAKAAQKIGTMVGGRRTRKSRR